jgi:hypothetical protein
MFLMSQSLRNLKAAVREFANRPLEEDIDPDQLRDVLDELEGELEMLYEPPEERAAMRAEVGAMVKKALLQIKSRQRATFLPVHGEVARRAGGAGRRVGWRVRRPG